MNNMVTKFDSHQLEYQSIEPIATLLIMFRTKHVGIYLVFKDNGKRSRGKVL